ncbi:DoxX family protein [Raineyella sp. LH-20]|uniref:DoxX family protein n=1 Tax=Raineyella sp. LH-20 TaxID=3081204 RepID=UPI002952CFE8|nr:DoxX family protein [Raineyella sp. LH-20]WOP18503.1 DoxX family protein [Raineyella sp. LH-20]
MSPVTPALDADTDAAAPGPGRRPVLDWVGLVCRLGLGGVLVVAGALKVSDLDQSVLAVRGYQVLPYDLAVVVGYALPPLEIIVGLLLIAGLFTRWAALIGSLFMVAFVVGITQAWVRGLTIDCGCFGGGGQVAANQTKYGLEILRDLGLMALGVFLVVRPHTRFAVEDRLFALAPVAPLADDETHPDETPETD